MSHNDPPPPWHEVIMGWALIAFLLFEIWHACKYGQFNFGGLK